MNILYDKLCTISTTSIINVGWEDTKSYTPIYTSIPCDFFTPANKYSHTQQAREFETRDLEVVLTGDKTLVKKGMKISLSDQLWTDYWSYVINDVQVYSLSIGKIENITLSVSERDVSG